MNMHLQCSLVDCIYYYQGYIHLISQKNETVNKTIDFALINLNCELIFADIVATL